MEQEDNKTTAEKKVMVFIKIDLMIQKCCKAKVEAKALGKR